MRFGVLGPLTVWTADGGPVAVPGTKARALLARLLVAPGRPVSTDRLVDDLWGDAVPDHPRNALQGQVSRLRAALDRAEPGARGLVVQDTAGYRLRPEPGAVDAERFAELLRRARTGADAGARVALLTGALGLWRGDAFAGYADRPFARAAAHRLEEDRLTALEDRLALRADLGEYAEIAGEAEELVAAHPLRERLRAVQLRALYRAGRQADALAGYESLRRTLDDELGLAPGAELVALHGAILRHDPSLGGSGDGPSHETSGGGAVAARARTDGPETPVPQWSGGVRLPAPVTELVGREEAVAGAALRLAGSRLVTLTGPGGVGKTRLAVEVARRGADRFPDGVVLAEFAGLAPAPGTGPDEVAEALLTVLGVRAAGDGGARLSPRERLGRMLRERRLLLVLDNCEHVVEPVADVVGGLLPGASGVSVLATSQEPLGAAGESVLPVQPLRPADAVALFTARAALPPGFADDPGDAAALAALCARLDGVPLALELAAARARSLGVHGLLHRLDDRFALLSGGPRNGPARQRTLRAVLDWSWELLAPAERTVLRRLSVQAEGCALEAAEAVCADDGAPGNSSGSSPGEGPGEGLGDGFGDGGIAAGDVLDLLARLVDRSFVVVADRAGGPVYRLLESVKAYGAERLEAAGETGAVRDRHSRHYTGLALRAAPELRGPGQRQWLELLDGACSELRQAVAHAVRGGAAERALRTVDALVWYWVLRGMLDEARRTLDLVLAMPPKTGAGGGGVAYARVRARVVVWRTGVALLAGDAPDAAGAIATALAPYRADGGGDDPAGYARALWFLSAAQLGAGDVGTGEELADGALERFAALGDDWGTAAALSVRARHALARGDLAAVRRDGERSARLFTGLGDPWGRLQTVFPLAVLAEVGGDYERAARLHRDGLAIAERLGLAAEAAKRHTGLGRLALLTGDHAAAHDHHERALRLARDHGLRSGEADARLGLALGARRSGGYAEAEGYLRELLWWFREVDYGPGTALVLAELGFVAELRGDPALAAARHREGLAVARGLGDVRAVALALEGLAAAGAAAGAYERCAVLLGAAGAARDSVGAPLPVAERGDVDRAAGRARGALGPAGYAAGYARGRSLGEGELAAYVGVGSHL
ncbi:BTAD domain-containing putative transcriptional regulator [Streptomyces yaizuensis]|uniref:Winged helix-turn-helix domain-containing protein n=1 Tax=Streptomyces yaizuensis TaxID=2989713 RepID=A0ABQ5NWX1_9ACTN|nr:BTAD domain-containing putative transcriptional regulator [Streptomyces sp. YSPA8]GLF94873.1 winged helix-turn-helix domain-containing protein [Streptomyces sp. YSPA8]